MRISVTLSGETYGYEKELFFIISLKDGILSIPFAHTNMQKTWDQLFNRAYNLGIYMVDTSEDEDETWIERLIQNKNPAFVGNGIYDLNTNEPIFLIWWNSFTYKGEFNKIISIEEALLMYNEDELNDIFQKLALVCDVEINGRLGFGSCEKLIFKDDNCWEKDYNKDICLLHFVEDGKPSVRSN